MKRFILLALFLTSLPDYRSNARDINAKTALMKR